VPTTTSTVPAAYADASARSHHRRVHSTTTQAHHSAQPTCSEGIAASSLVSPPSPLGALASLPHHPCAEVEASTSTYPGSIRGGAIGSRTNPTRPVAVAATSTVRALR